MIELLQNQKIISNQIMIEKITINYLNQFGEQGLTLMQSMDLDIATSKLNILEEYADKLQVLIEDKDEILKIFNKED